MKLTNNGTQNYRDTTGTGIASIKIQRQKQQMLVTTVDNKGRYNHTILPILSVDQKTDLSQRDYGKTKTTKTDFSKLDYLPIDDIEKLRDMKILELKDEYIRFNIPVVLTIPYGESYVEIKVGEEHVGKPLRDINNNKSLQEQIKIYNEIVDMIDNNKLTQEEINELKKQGYIDITTDKHEIIVNRDFTKFTQRFPYQPGLVLGYLQTDNGKICTFRDNVHMYH